MLNLQEKIEIVLICGENTGHRQVADIFNARHPARNIHQSTVSRIIAKFKSTGSVEMGGGHGVSTVIHFQDHHAEIIVFPEYGFTGIVEDPTNYALEVPDVGAQVTLIKKILYKIAQAAKDKLYVAMNFLEKVPKSKNETIYYNTNVVFDKNMTVVAKYRKVNLYNEPKLTPGDPNQNTSIFTTDFNVTFGMFIGYDMLSYNPSRSILENSSITDVILPTAWFSTLPFFHCEYKYVCLY
nr:vanin-like protein 2 [Leptinotarsa decemlineata]